jgi:hypothetical protein
VGGWGEEEEQGRSSSKKKGGRERVDGRGEVFWEVGAALNQFPPAST